MIIKTTIKEFQENLSLHMDNVWKKGQKIIVTKNDMPLFVVKPASKIPKKNIGTSSRARTVAKRARKSDFHTYYGFMLRG